MLDEPGVHPDTQIYQSSEHSYAVLDGLTGVVVTGELVNETLQGVFVSWIIRNMEVCIVSRWIVSRKQSGRI